MITVFGAYIQESNYITEIDYIMLKARNRTLHVSYEAAATDRMIAGLMPI